MLRKRPPCKIVQFIDASNFAKNRQNVKGELRLIAIIPFSVLLWRDVPKTAF